MMRKQVKVLMFGWEFPPLHSGGLGVACEGLVRGLVNMQAKIYFVLPKKVDGISLRADQSFYKFIFANEKIDDISNIKVKIINSLLTPYLSSSEYIARHQKSILSQNGNVVYGLNLFEEVMRYKEEAIKIARQEDFDVIHAHDWLSFPAGIVAKQITGKPFIAHIHATEFDRTGGGERGVNNEVYNIEKQGFDLADKIIAVSNFTKNKVIKHYQINPEKITVVHNAVEKEDLHCSLPIQSKLNKKIILFLGRITIQKGADYFLKAAKKVLEVNPDVYFIIAGTGDMESQIIEETASMGISDKVLFAGFVQKEKLAHFYKMADLYVLPSISEPFGLTPLEAITCGTPALISKQSGVSEVISHCLKVDFWDTDQMANQILAILEYSELKEELQKKGGEEVQKFNWNNSARKCIDIYQSLINN